MATRSETTAKLIQIAVSLVGRVRAREALGCSEEALGSYERGELEIPIDDLAGLIAVIVAEQSAEISKYRERLSKLKRRGLP